MAWQPSRVVPGLAQYLAAKGIAFAPKDCEITRLDAVCAEPSPTASLMQLDAAIPFVQPELQPPYPPAKRVKTDARAQSWRPASPSSESDHVRPDCAPALSSALPCSAKSIDDLPPLLRSSLLPFQEEGVAFAIQRGGRVMIADDMGLGSRNPLYPSHIHGHVFSNLLLPCSNDVCVPLAETLQAISLCWLLRDHWPVLVIMPASMRAAWAEELERWLPALHPGSIKMWCCNHTNSLARVHHQLTRLCAAPASTTQMASTLPACF